MSSIMPKRLKKTHYSLYFKLFLLSLHPIYIQQVTLKRLTYVFVLIICVRVTAFAQLMDNSHKVEKLSQKERISVRTSLTDWVLLTPNIGIEYDLGSKNWNRYSLNINLRYRPSSSDTYVQPVVFNIFEATLEGRVYWRERQAQSSGYLRRHTNLWDKLWSCRVMVPSHPKWIFYRGLYLTYSDYNIYFDGINGRAGQAIMFGGSWGFIKPFLAFQNGNSLDMEFGLSIGLCYQKFHTYTHYKKDNTYRWRSHVNWRLETYPMPRDIHIGVVYRFGNYPIQKKYRWRYDVDMEYRARIDSIYEHNLSHKEQKFIRDSIYKVVSKDFRVLYDSCVQVRKAEAQQAIDARAPKRIEPAVTTEKKQQKKKSK